MAQRTFNFSRIGITENSKNRNNNHVCVSETLGICSILLCYDARMCIFYCYCIVCLVKTISKNVVSQGFWKSNLINSIRWWNGQIFLVLMKLHCNKAICHYNKWIWWKKVLAKQNIRCYHSFNRITTPDTTLLTWQETGYKNDNISLCLGDVEVLPALKNNGDPVF